MDDINAYLEEFSKANNVKALWSISDDPIRAAKALEVVLQGNIKRVRGIYLYPREGAIDFTLLKERLEVLLCELGREEGNNG